MKYNHIIKSNQVSMLLRVEKSRDESRVSTSVFTRSQGQATFASNSFDNRHYHGYGHHHSFSGARRSRSCMAHLGFTSCKADPDIWMQEGKKDDGSAYWEYVLLYVDDALCISNNAENVSRNEIGKYFVMKPGSIAPPKIYLGNKVPKVTLDNGVDAWSFSSSQYVQNAVANVEAYLRKLGKSLPRKATAPFTTGYCPEIDTTAELDPVEQAASYYQSLIGIIRWIVELGRVDITAEASMMASCMAMPRRGHLDQLFHMFAFLKRNKHNSEMLFYPSEPDTILMKHNFLVTRLGLIQQYIS